MKEKWVLRSPRQVVKPHTLWLRPAGDQFHIVEQSPLKIICYCSAKKEGNGKIKKKKSLQLVHRELKHFMEPWQSIKLSFSIIQQENCEGLFQIVLYMAWLCFGRRTATPGFTPGVF